jgi:hypothetical protein
MISPDLSLLRQKIGLKPGEDFDWVHQMRLMKNSGGYYTIVLGGSKKAVSIRWLRSLLHLSRLDRNIEQHKRT